MSKLYLCCVQSNEAIRYLEFCVQCLSCEDQAIHNYLLSLYAKLQPDQLMKYLHFQGQVRITVLSYLIATSQMKAHP